MDSETAAALPSSPPVPPSEVRAMLSDYARMLKLRGERSVLLRREAIAALEHLATMPDAPAASGALVRREQPAKAPGEIPQRTVLPRAESQSQPPAALPVQRPVSVAGTAPQAQSQGLTAVAGVTPAEPAAPAGGSGTKAERLAKLRAQVTPCTMCEHLAASRTQTVFGVGNPDCDIMFVGEAPGADEDRQGEPFVGAAGQLLTKMIIAMKLTRDDVFIANVLKCRPDMPAGASGNRKPTPAEMRTCLPYLRQQISIIKPRVLVALGLTAVEGLRGVQPGTITLSKMRGQFTEFEGIPLMPTFHPAYLLRNQQVTEKRKAWEDLMKVMEKAGLPIDDRQRNYFLPKAV